MDMSGYVYTCAGGETFDSVALELFGSERYAAELLNANPEHCMKMIFTGGEILRIPVIELPDAEEAELPVTAPWRNE